MSRTTVPMVSLKGRVFFHDRTGEIEDFTQDTWASFQCFADRGQLAAKILNETISRLHLLRAATCSAHMKAEHVRVAVDDLLQGLENCDDLSGYIKLTTELFENAEPFPSKAKRVPYLV